MAFLFIFSAILLAFVTYPFLLIVQNYSQARKLGLPILITPFAPLNPLWALGQPYLAPFFTYLATHLPPPFCRLFSFVHYSTGGWYFSSRHASHPLPFQYYAPAFLIVSPAETQLILSDPSAADDVLSRRKDFIKSAAMYGPLELFGPNVDTLNGEAWARHRRITTPPFNERNSSVVWKESLRQASGMLQSWLAKSRTGDGVSNTANDTMALALHVLTAAGFGKRYEFGAGVQEIAAGHSMSYRDSLKIVLGNLYRAIVMSLLFPHLPSFLTPSNLLKVKEAINEFKGYMVEMVEDEKRTMKERGAEGDNLMSVMLRASNSEAEGMRTRSRIGLNDEEILGNLFIYNFAGHDTTANSIGYAVVLLATDSQYQDWIGEEINSVFGGKENVEDWEYEFAFLRLKRCLALMYETLRLYGPVIFIPKYTGDSSQPLTIASKSYIIPPRTYVTINIAATHTLPSYWGSDALAFRPDRFLVSSGGSLEEEELVQPPAGIFLAWASGPRACPGKKFAQVEFVAVIARLFMSYRVSPKLEVGETRGMAQERVRRHLLESEMGVTLNVKNPESIRLVWEKKT